MADIGMDDKPDKMGVDTWNVEVFVSVIKDLVCIYLSIIQKSNF